MKGHIVNLEGQLVCIFPFTHETDFEAVAHNDLKAYRMHYDDDTPEVPHHITADPDMEASTNYFGSCFVSTDIYAVDERGHVGIKTEDQKDIAELARSNDEWLKEKKRLGD